MATPTPIQQLTALCQRLGRARALVADGAVSPVVGRDDAWVVQGHSGPYLVTGDDCSCEDFEFRTDLHLGQCKHRLAVACWREQQVDVPAPKVEVRHPHPDPCDKLERQLAELFG